MIRSMLVLTTFLVLACPSFAWAQRTIFSYTLDKSYRTTITRKALQASPAWRNDAENPPLSAREARRLADETRARLVKDTPDFTWRLESIALTPTSVEGRWFWLAYYTADFKGTSTGQDNFLKVAILMDGTVAEQVPLKRSE
jgi:hypothetical protein